MRLPPWHGIDLEQSLVSRQRATAMAVSPAIYRQVASCPSSNSITKSIRFLRSRRKVATARFFPSLAYSV